MNKKEKEIIKGVIETLWADRQKLFDKHEEIQLKLRNRSLDQETRNKLRRQLHMNLIPTAESDTIGKQLILLNTLLEETEQKQEVICLAQEMEKIQAKNILNPKQFFEKYNISISRQRDFRTRLNDPLPYHQMVHRGSISYYVNEVDKWLESNNKH